MQQKSAAMPYHGRGNRGHSTLRRTCRSRCRRFSCSVMRRCSLSKPRTSLSFCRSSPCKLVTSVSRLAPYARQQWDGAQPNTSQHLADCHDTKETYKKGRGGGLGPKSVCTTNGPTRFSLLANLVFSHDGPFDPPPPPPMVYGHSNTSLTTPHLFAPLRTSQIRPGTPLHTAGACIPATTHNILHSIITPRHPMIGTGWLSRGALGCCLGGIEVNTGTAEVAIWRTGAHGCG